MIHMGLLNIIRRMFLRDKLSIREIARRTGLSRNTITKHVSSGTIEPKFETPDRPSKLDPYADKLAGWLKIEACKSRKQRRNLKQLHADLVTLGFDGSYDRVAAFARKIPRSGTPPRTRNPCQYDNMKTAVDRVGRGKERHINMRFLAMANHYVFEPEFCNPAAERPQRERRAGWAGREECARCSPALVATNTQLSRSGCT